MDKNAFTHDATPTWSGFLYQGRVAVYLALEKIISLDAEDIEQYALEMENCEDIAIIRTIDSVEQYISIHQVKHENSETLNGYKKPLVQLMLEKGYCESHRYGKPEAYLHTSKGVKVTEEELDQQLSSWKDVFKQCYGALEKVHEQEEQIEASDVEKLLELLGNSKNTILLNRTEYRKRYEAVEKSGEAWKKTSGIEKVKELQQAIEELMEYMDQQLGIGAINSEVTIYKYDDGKSYCDNGKMYDQIIKKVKQIKGMGCVYTEEQYGFLVDKLINLVDKKVVACHESIQSSTIIERKIGLDEFKVILDEMIEKSDKVANIATLKRCYGEEVQKYCLWCNKKQQEDECWTNCLVYNWGYETIQVADDEFMRFCYYLNPECEKKITDRQCIYGLLNRDGLQETVFRALCEVAQNRFLNNGKDGHIKVYHGKDVAFLTAISNGRVDQIVAEIETAVMKRKQENFSIITLFDADQLVTTRINAPSNAWDNSYIKLESEQAKEIVSDSDWHKQENSIYVAKRPEFITINDLLEE